MEMYIEKNSKGIISFNLLSLVIIIMAMLLNHTAIVGDVNLSFADFLVLIIFLMLFVNRNLSLPYIPTVFFLIVSITALLTSAFLVPDVFLYYPNLRSIIINYTKLIAVFIYFIIGYNISKIKYIDKTIKWYSFVALCIGMVGIVFTFLNIGIFRDTLYFGGSRFNGFMNDPNYFSIIQLTALVYFTRSKKINGIYRILAVIIIFTSILLSGSKTGFIAFGVYLSYRTMLYIFSKDNNIWIKIFQILSIILALLIFSNFLNLINSFMDLIANVIPSFYRLQLLIYNFGAALTEGGSGRSIVWLTALKIIEHSPLLGVGVGTYSGVATRLVGSDAIAHNTYLQLSAEWGLLLATIFFTSISYFIGKIILLNSKKSESIIILNDIIIIFFVGSIGISLNNARMFWLFLGALIFLIYKLKND